MKHIYVNLKRFDIPETMHGVNYTNELSDWARKMIEETKDVANHYQNQAEFVMFFPEAHLIQAVAKAKNSAQRIGAQGCYHKDVSKDGNFGALTSHRPASVIKAMGCTHVLIGHYEERRHYQEVYAMANVQRDDLIQKVCHQEMQCALAVGLRIVYCIGEQEAQKYDWKAVLKSQITLGLAHLDTSKIVLAYEPIWSIGPGKTPPDQATIQERIAYIKEVSGGMDVVYGGGLKQENAKMLSDIQEVDGGLIALTRFTGELGFYPEEYQDIVERYLGKGEL